MRIEDKIKAEAIKYLKNGKPDWDIPHTLDAVLWMKKLIKKEGGNKRVLVTAMYLHDIGYPKLKKGYDFDEMIKAKKHHAELGAIRAKKILKKLRFSKSEIDEIIFLVRGHYSKDFDKDNKYNSDLRLVVEADGLAKINWNKVPPSFDRENCQRYFEYFKKRAGKQFRTKTGRRFFRELLIKAERYLKHWPL